MSAQTNLFEREIDKKTGALDSFERSKKEWIEEARKKARHFCYKNTGLIKYGIPNTVTTDDVRLMMDVSNSGARYANNAMGSVLRKGFEKCGRYNSKANGSHSREISIWQLKAAE